MEKNLYFVKGYKIYIINKKKSQYEKKYYLGNVFYTKVYNISNKFVKR